MRLSWEIEPAGFFTPPQFEEDYRTQLKGFLSMGEFDGVLSSVNRLLRRSGSGTCNVGCFLGCCCCCFAVMRRNNRKALEDARMYLATINQDSFVGRGMRWDLVSEDDDAGDEENVVLVLDIPELVDQQPAKRCLSFESQSRALKAAHTPPLPVEQGASKQECML